MTEIVFGYTIYITNFMYTKDVTMIKGINRTLALSLACVLTVTGVIGLLPANRVNAREGKSAITVDGKFDDWQKINKLSSNTSDIKEWSVCRDDENMYIYVESAGNQWGNNLDKYTFEFGNDVTFGTLVGIHTVFL